MALAETIDVRTIDEFSTEERFRYVLTVFEDAGPDQPEQLGGDQFVFSLADGLTVFPPTVIPLRNGEFAAYQSTFPDLDPDGAAPTVEIRLFDELGIEEDQITQLSASALAGNLIDLGVLPGDVNYAVFDPFRATLRRVDPLTGAIGRLSDAIDLSQIGSVLPLDDGTLIQALSGDFLAQGATLDVGVAGPAGDVPSFAFPELPVSLGRGQFDLIAAGNLLVLQSVDIADRGVSRPEFTIVRPDDARDPVTVELAQPNTTTAIATTEVKGIGFATFIVYADLSGGVTISTDAEIVLMDFDGDILARRTVADAVGANFFSVFDTIGLLDLARPHDDGVRLLTSWTDAPFGPGNKTMLGEVFQFSPRIDVTGSFRDDVLLGLGRNDQIAGSGGNDLLLGAGGDDTLLGGAGDDRIDGDDGDDLIRGDVGEDILRGLRGNDAIRGNGGNDTISGQAGKDQLFGDNGDDRARGGSGNDDLFGGSGDDTLDGESGKDRLGGQSGNDTLNGGQGNDALDGGAGQDHLAGGGGKDVLRGGDGDDILDGGAGDDRLISGRGADDLTGDAGADRFVLVALTDSSNEAGVDLITDFSIAEGDRIDLSAIDAKSRAPGNNAFVFIGAAEFSNRRGELRIDLRDTASTTILGDVDGDGREDLSLTLSGNFVLTASEFVL